MGKSKEVKIAKTPDENQDSLLAQTVLRPTILAAATLTDYDKAFGEVDLMSLVDALGKQTKAVNEGELQRSEAMLTAQAHTLDAIFNNLARRAINTEYMDNLDRYLKLALKAQSQCRSTWEAISNIKNPPVVGYVKQANISHGPQQVNNASTSSDEVDSAEKNRKMKNKLLEEDDGKRLDTRATCTPSQTDPEMATLV